MWKITYSKTFDKPSFPSFITSKYSLGNTAQGFGNARNKRVI